ncbi:MAG: hypothetical protein ACTHM7_21635 [Ginsengibacter sp.]
MTLDSTVGIIGVVLTAVGILLTLKSFSRAIPFYAIRVTYLFRKTQEIIKDKKIKILYNDDVVEQIVLTKLCFWNAGSKLLSFEKASVHVPLSICFKKGSKIFSCEIEFQTNEHNAAKVEFDSKSNCLYITFDYLNTMEGFIIKIIHDNYDTNSFKVKGAFKGSPDLKFSNYEAGTFDPLESLTIIASCFIIMFLSSKWIPHSFNITIMSIYLVFLLIVFGRYYFYRRARIIPKMLRKKL